jgi:hypothetical protein
VASKFPVEIWRIVGEFFTSAIDLVNLAYISPQALSAAADLARYPWVLEYRLVDVAGSIPPIPETTEQTNVHEICEYYIQLGRAKFTAVKGGRRVTVELGQESGGETSNRFEVMSYSRYELRERNKSYVLELDDDEVTVMKRPRFRCNYTQTSHCFFLLNPCSNQKQTGGFSRNSAVYKNE